MIEDTPSAPDTSVLVATGDGALFRCRIHRIGEAEQRRWMFTDLTGTEFMGPPVTGPLQEWELRDLVREWWEAKKAAAGGAPDDAE